MLKLITMTVRESFSAMIPQQPPVQPPALARAVHPRQNGQKSILEVDIDKREDVDRFFCESLEVNCVKENEIYEELRNHRDCPLPQ
jgi:hypothetical protein